MFLGSSRLLSKEATMLISVRSAGIVILTALVGGCAAPVDGAADEETSSTAEAVTVAYSYRVTGYTYNLGYHGGTGGNPTTESCRAGDLAVGVYGSYGNYINELGLICATLYSNGTLGPPYTTRTTGTPGPHTFTVQCPMRAFGWDNDQFLAGLRGRSATYVDDIGAICVALPSFEPDATWSINPVSGGSAFYDPCPDSYGVTSLYVRGASWIDAVRATCSYVAR
jgi:hypothetical protein